MLLFKFKFLSFPTDQLTHLHQRRWSWTEPQWRTWKPREGRRIWWQQVLDIEDICGFARAKKRWIHIGEEFCKMMILFALASSLHSPHKLLCVDFTVLEEKKQFDEKGTWKEEVIVYVKKRKGDLKKWKWIWVDESGWETVKVDMKKKWKGICKSESWTQHLVEVCDFWDLVPKICHHFLILGVPEISHFINSNEVKSR